MCSDKSRGVLVGIGIRVTARWFRFARRSGGARFGIGVIARIVAEVFAADFGVGADVFGRAVKQDMAVADDVAVVGDPEGDTLSAEVADHAWGCFAP